MSNEHLIRNRYSNLKAPGSGLYPQQSTQESADDFNFYVQGFLLKHRSQRHSPRTIQFYQWNLERFRWFLKEEGYPTNLSSISPLYIRAFLVYLQEDPGDSGRWGVCRPSSRKPLTPASVHGFARSLRAFFRWATKEADLPRNPFSLVDMPSLPNRWQVTVFTDEEIAQLFAACENFGLPFTVQRNRCILAVLLDSGIRAGELLSLKVGDINPGEGLFTVRGKRNRERQVVVGNFARRELWAYLHRFRLKMSTPFQELWVSHQGAPLTYAGLRLVFTRLSKLSGITRVPVHPHVCRHTFATQAHRNGMRGATLQEALGHEQFDTTRRYYLNISKEDLLAEHAKYGPLDHLRHELHLEDGSGTRSKNAVPKELPPAEVLAREVAQSNYRAVARKYQMSDMGVRKRLKKAGLIP